MTNSFWISGKTNQKKKKKKREKLRSNDRPTNPIKIYAHSQRTVGHKQRKWDKASQIVHVLHIEIYNEYKITFTNILEIDTFNTHTHMPYICHRTQAPQTIDPFVHKFLHVKEEERDVEREIKRDAHQRTTTTHQPNIHAQFTRLSHNHTNVNYIARQTN